LLAPNAAWRAHFAAAGVDAILTAHDTGAENYERQVFGLLTFELWHREFVKG
jgi:hypothetical protein